MTYIISQAQTVQLGRYQRLSFRIHSGAMERMTRDNLDVLREVLLERRDLRCLARRLTTNNGAQSRSCTYKQRSNQ